MLAKQGWKLLTNTNKLAYRVLKAKDFPNRSLLESKLGGNPSLTWRSILETKCVVEQGVRWRVGNGKTIRTRKDIWLPSNHRCLPDATRDEWDENCHVSDFIDENTM
ncbi:uncharacterized protein LOC111315159 [Durio zibethinus]|uniref:Uncharacterized protein LOC111315159 n=1 Tax=Durio zibethinus TaxID=66656 RepID=A0A6P6B5M1_DURZI|nr:uncharacterized protein LOC111315159 [Durio zibethinus]